MKKTIYILGNPLLPTDSLPVNILPQLQKNCPDFSFEVFDPTEDLPLDTDQEFIFIDTVIGIDTVIIFHDLRYFAYSPRVTVHDFDLPLNLGVLQKLGKIKKITIIGIPQESNTQKTIQEIVYILYNQLILRK